MLLIPFRLNTTKWHQKHADNIVMHLHVIAPVTRQQLRYSRGLYTSFYVLVLQKVHLIQSAVFHWKITVGQ